MEPEDTVRRSVVFIASDGLPAVRPCDSDDARDVADLIDALRQKLADERAITVAVAEVIDRLRAENDRLRAENDRLKHLGNWLAENLTEFGDPHDDMVLKRWAELRGEQQ